MAGYSGTPLWRKLGLKDGMEASVLGAPEGYLEALGLPAGMEVAWRARPATGIAFVHLFERRGASLSARLKSLRMTIAPSGMVWVSWPKKASGVATDITEDRVRAAALPLGLVDIKVCAVDGVWSGLKLVIRVAERRP